MPPNCESDSGQVKNMASFRSDSPPRLTVPPVPCTVLTVPLKGVLNKKSEVGNFLLSQEAALQVPSADTRLTAGFGMFPGIPTLLWSPTSLFSYLIQYAVSCSQVYLPDFLRKTSLFLTPRKSLRSLVPVCSIHYCTFTSGLSSK